LKLKCDEQLSNVAFKFNVRRYIKGANVTAVTVVTAVPPCIPIYDNKVGRFKSKPALNAPGFSAALEIKL
jgi:hypothetical protein